MPNHYDTDVYCRKCGKYLFSYLHLSEDSGRRFCNKNCKKAYEAEHGTDAIHQQIANAKQSIKQLKKTSPYIFPEWQRLENAKSTLAKAEKELATARVAWFMLGNEK